MRKISIDNGHSYTTPAEALEAVGMETLAQYMDDETRERVHAMDLDSEESFLAAYLELAAEDLVIG